MKIVITIAQITFTLLLRYNYMIDRYYFNNLTMPDVARRIKITGGSSHRLLRYGM